MRPAWRGVVRKRVVVNLRNGRAFEGVLYAQRGPLLVLKNATLHEPGAAPAGVDGEVVVERSAVDFIQVTG